MLERLNEVFELVGDAVAKRLIALNFSPKVLQLFQRSPLVERLAAQRRLVRVWLVVHEVS